MKGVIKTPEKELNKMEICNLSEAEFKTLVTRMLKEFSEGLNSIKRIKSVPLTLPFNWIEASHFDVLL